MAAKHGLTSKTHTGEVPISTVAFYSSSDELENPPCDGFFQYIPGTGELFKWINLHGIWKSQLTGRLIWTNETTYRVERQ
jgi:hypothetical protein